MKTSSLSRVKSPSALYILLLSSGLTEIYLVKPSGSTLVSTHSGSPQPADAARIAAQYPAVPWAILVDQSEETFWGGVMPPLKGAAKTVWIDRMANQSGTTSPYRWSEVQGKSASQEGKLRVLGYTLGRPEALTPWLDHLKNCGARIRGVYAPVMLTNIALKALRIKTNKAQDAISVLVTPHKEGLRQTVLVGNKVRFSRLALHPTLEGSQWFDTVLSESAKLREYLVGNGLLKSDRTGMDIHCVLPHSAKVSTPVHSKVQHDKDRYQWLEEAAPEYVYLAALAAQQSWQQLAPKIYRRHDLSAQICKMIATACTVVVIAALGYLLYAGAKLWSKNGDVSLAEQSTQLAIQQYALITKTFPQTPLSAPQLIDMSKRWETIKSQVPPSMSSALSAAGQILEKHPSIKIEDFLWLADVTQSGGDIDPLVGGQLPALAGTGTMDTAPGEVSKPAAAAKLKPEITALVMRGRIEGVGSEDLRGTRDVLAKLEADFNKQPQLRAEITKRPLDLSSKTALTGSGTQDKSELSFELKLWQR